MASVKFSVSVIRVGSSLRITIPKEIARHLDLTKGDHVDVWCDDGRVIVEKEDP